MEVIPVRPVILVTLLYNQLASSTLSPLFHCSQATVPRTIDGRAARFLSGNCLGISYPADTQNRRTGPFSKKHRPLHFF